VTATGRTLTVAGRFHGPVGSANGGYLAGRLAGFVLAAAGEPAVGGASGVTVTLRRPPPLDLPMSVELLAGRAELRCDGALVAEAELAGSPPDPAPSPVPLEAAAAAAAAADLGPTRPYADCFACGPARAEGDGLRVVTGPAGPATVAGPWTPAPDATGPEHVWAALDCPTGFALAEFGARVLLGRITGWVHRLPVPGRPHVVVGRSLGGTGRTRGTVGALYDDGGGLLAVTRLIWVLPR
jgi:hypothetical protein